MSGAPERPDPSTGPTRAVALRYDPASDAAPVVLASGQGLVAEEIVRRARAAGVSVTEDGQLAAVLSRLDVGTMIPPELYAVVAGVLAYVYRLDARVARRRSTGRAGPPANTSVLDRSVRARYGSREMRVGW